MKQGHFRSPNTAARTLGVDRATIIRWIRAGDLPASVTPGGRYRIHDADLILVLRPVRRPKAQS